MSDDSKLKEGSSSHRGAFAALVMGLLPLGVGATQDTPHTRVDLEGDRVKYTSLSTGHSWYQSRAEYNDFMNGKNPSDLGFDVVAPEALREEPVHEPPHSVAKVPSTQQSPPGAATSAGSKSSLSSVVSLNWIKKQIEKNLHGSIQTGFSLPTTGIPGLGARVSGSYNLRRIGSQYRRSDAFTIAASVGQGINIGTAATAALPLSASATISRQHQVIFTRQSQNYYGMALDGVYLPTSVPSHSGDIQKIDVGTMVSLPSQTSLGPGIGMERIIPLLGSALGGQAVVARTGVVAGLSAGGSFDVHLFRQDEHNVGLIVRSFSSDGYSAGVDIRVGTQGLRERTDPQYSFATRKIEKRLQVNPLTWRPVSGSRSGGGALYLSFDLRRPDHRAAFDHLLPQLRGMGPLVGTSHDIKNAFRSVGSQLKGGSSSTAADHSARLGELADLPHGTLVLAVTSAGSSFSRDFSTHLPLLAKVAKDSSHQFITYLVNSPETGRPLYVAHADAQRGTSMRFLMGFAGDGELRDRSIVRAISYDSNNTTRAGISEISREFRLSANNVGSNDVVGLASEIAVKLGPTLFSKVGQRVTVTLEQAARSDGVVALEVNATLTSQGVRCLMAELLRHVNLSPKNSEMILTSLLRTKLDEYLYSLEGIRFVASEESASSSFQHRETTIFDAFFGKGDGTQQSIQTAASFLSKMLTTWPAVSERAREEMMASFVALLHHDEIFRQVGLGFLCHIAAGDAMVPRDDFYQISLVDRVGDGNAVQGTSVHGSQLSRDLINRAQQLCQSGEASAFDTFSQWMPRAQGPAGNPDLTIDVVGNITPTEQPSLPPRPPVGQEFLPPPVR